MSQTIDLHVVGSSSRELLEAMQGGATYVFENVDTYGQGVTVVTLRKVLTSVRSLPVGCTAQLVKPLKLTEGTVLTEFPAGTQVRIGGYANFGGADVAVINVIGRHFAGTILPEFLEAVPTAEQIAAEVREVKAKQLYLSLYFREPQGVWESKSEDQKETFRRAIDDGWHKS